LSQEDPKNKLSHRRWDNLLLASPSNTFRVYVLYKSQTPTT